MKVRKIVTGTAASLGLVVGFAALAGATSGAGIDHTGPDSYNKIRNHVSSYVRVENTNNLSASNRNYQTAYTGDAKVWGNTEGGGAYTGDAMNDNSFSASATVHNSTPSGTWAHNDSAAGGGSISVTGPDSHNVIDNSTRSVVKIQNTNDLNVTNSNHQTAISGDATVAHNTTGGDAVTGDAVNTNSTSVTFNVSN